MTANPPAKETNKSANTSVLLMMNPGDIAYFHLYQRIKNAGYQVTLFNGSTEPDDVSDPFDIVIDAYDPYETPSDETSPFPLLENTHDSTLRLIDALQSYLSSSQAYCDPSEKMNMVGYSPIALYTSADTQENVIVECSKNSHTSDAARQAAEHFFSTLLCQPLWIPHDTPALIVGRIVAMLANEGASAVMEGVASVDAVDNAMRYGTNYPQGPLKWADLIGLDVVLTILENCYRAYREERYRPVLLLQQKVAEGKLGVKTGEGFYSYTPQVNTSEPTPIEAS